MPPLYLNSVRLASPVFESVWRSSVSVMSRPLFRNASSRRRCESVSKLYSSVAGENSFVGHEVNLGAGLHFGGAGFSQLAGGLALRVSLLPGETVAPDFQFQFFAERVDAAHAHAVQSAGNFVGIGVELAARVQRGHHDLCGGNFFAVDVHVVDGNAAAVVDDGDGIVEMNGDFDLVGVTGERLVNRVIDNFVDQVMQAEFARRADVHGGTLAHGFHAAEHFDGVGGVVGVGRSQVSRFFALVLPQSVQAALL